MNKLILTLICLAFLNHANSQTTQDTVNNAYWRTMMFDHSISIFKTKRAFDLYFSNKAKVKGTGYKQFERWYENCSNKVDVNGFMPAPDNTIKEYKKFLRNNLKPRSATGNWTNVGLLAQPTSTYGVPVSTGRVAAIAFHPSDPNKIYAGAPQGGFWRSTDKGANWVSSTDNLPTLGVADIAVIDASPNPIILIGTGDRDANDAAGLGVYKSTDGGVSFTVSNTGMGNKTVNKLVVNQMNTNTILAATSGGIYVSYNQGANWVLKSPNSSNYKDIKYCPDDSTIAYATQGGTFYRSTDGGSTWSSVTSGFTGSRNRMAIAVTPMSSNIVYVVASNSSNSDLQAVYKSSNYGQSFTQLATTPEMLSGQGWYDIAIESSISDSNIVYVGGLNVYKSVNGASSFTKVADWTGSGVPWVHADIHYIGRNPLNNELWIGSNGAISYTVNEGSSYTHVHNGLAISQIYNIGVSQTSKTRFIMGLQDNGTMVGSSSSTILARVGGDGMECEISDLDSTKLFGNVQYGDLRRSTNNGTSWQDISSTIPNGPGPWVSPCKLHPRLNDIMVVLYKNASLSKDIITAGTPSFTEFTSGITASGSALRFSNVNDSFVFMGWSNGTFKYANILAATPSATVVNGANPSGASKITDIETSFNNENVVYATAGNNIYKSTNKGSSWTDISLNLPNIPMMCVVLDKNSPEGLYVGTEAGVYYKDSLMSSWVLYNTNLPLNSEIRDLEIIYDTVCSSNSVIYAATYGRGLWKGDLYISETQPNPDFTIPAGACATLPVNITNTTTTVTNNGAPISYLWKITPNTFSYTGGTDSTSQNPIVSFNSTGSYTITLKASKPYGGFCTITKPNIITINTQGSLTLKTTADTSICSGDTVLVELGGMQNYTFDPNSSITKINDSTAYAFPTANTNYQIIGDVNGACFDTTYVQINVLSSAPYNQVGNKTIFCDGDSTIIEFTGIDTAYWTPTTFVTDISARQKKIKPNISTTYNVKLVKTGYCNQSLTIPILVKTIPSFSLSKSNPQSICYGQTINIIEQNGIPSIVWTPALGTNMISSSEYSFTPTDTTTYTITTSDTNYCSGVSQSIQINVAPIPNLTISGPNEVCSGDSVYLTASGAIGYTWSPGTYLNSTNTSQVLCIPSGSIVYNVTATNGTCTASSSKTINVGTNPVKLSYSGKTEACLGAGTYITVSGANEYLWSPREIVSNDTASYVKVNAPSSQMVKIVGMNTGCKDSLEIPITINPIPTISHELIGNTSICAGDKVSLKAMGGSSYYIDPLFNVTKYKIDSFVLRPTTTTDYTLFGSNEYGCLGKSEFKIEVYPIPIVTVQPALQTIKIGDSVVINASGGSSYEWTPNQYILGSNNTNTITVKPDSDIVYNVKVTSSQGCISNGIAIIYVQQDPNAPSSVSNSHAIQNILIYPNPVNSILHIESSTEMKASIYSISGGLVMDVNEFVIQHNITIDNIADGHYLLILEDKSGMKKISKIEIKK